MKDFDDTALKICRDQMTLGQINPWSSQVCFPPVGAVGGEEGRQAVIALGMNHLLSRGSKARNQDTAIHK